MLGATSFSGVVSVIALRSNSAKAQELYNELIEADKSGDNVEEALNELRSYIYGHMNTEIGSENGIHPPIQLQGTYTRLVEAEQSRVQNTNESVYDKAQDACEKQFGAGSLRNGRVQCVEDYVERNTVSIEQVSPDLYRFDFQPPLWSPDVAGFALLITAILSVILVFKLMVRFVRRIV